MAHPITALLCLSLHHILPTLVFFFHKANFMPLYKLTCIRTVSLPGICLELPLVHFEAWDHMKCLLRSYQDMLLSYLRFLGWTKMASIQMLYLSLIWTPLWLHFGSMTPFLNRGYISHSSFTIQCFNWWMLIQSTDVEEHTFYNHLSWSLHTWLSLKHSSYYQWYLLWLDYLQYMPNTD